MRFCRQHSFLGVSLFSFVERDPHVGRLISRRADDSTRRTVSGLLRLTLSRVDDPNNTYSVAQYIFRTL